MLLTLLVTLLHLPGIMIIAIWDTRYKHGMANFNNNLPYFFILLYKYIECRAHQNLFKSLFLWIFKQGSSFEESLASVWGVITEINRVMAHGSPVLIIQRFTRGYLLRKSFKAMQDMRIW